MTFTITLQEILVLLLTLGGLGVMIYLLILLKNTNQFITTASRTLESNEKRIEDSLKHLEELSGNSALFSRELKKQYENNEPLVRTIMQNGADSMLLVSDTTNRIRTLIASLNEIVCLVGRLAKGKK